MLLCLYIIFHNITYCTSQTIPTYPYLQNPSLLQHAPAIYRSLIHNNNILVIMNKSIFACAVYVIFAIYAFTSFYSLTYRYIISNSYTHVYMRFFFINNGDAFYMHSSNVYYQHINLSTHIHKYPLTEFSIQFTAQSLNSK